jgi:hypothetical protein
VRTLSIHRMHALRWSSSQMWWWTRWNILLRTILWVLTWSHMRRLTDIWWTRHRWLTHSHWRLSWSSRRTIWLRTILLSAKWGHLLLLIHLLLRVVIGTLRSYILILLIFNLLFQQTFVLCFSTGYLEISFPFCLEIFQPFINGLFIHLFHIIKVGFWTIKLMTS